VQANPPDRWQEVQTIHRQYKFFYKLGGSLVLLTLGVWIGSLLFRADSGYASNLYTTLLDVGITVLILNTLSEKREDKRLKAQLIREAGSSDNGIARRALKELAAYKWGFGDDQSMEKAYLHGANLHDASLDFANLQGSDLQFTNLNHARLTQANLVNAKLGYARMIEATPLYANLQKAQLHMADLRGAHLAGADLRNANLKRVNLEGALLWDADLRGANLQWSNLLNVEVRDSLSDFGEALFDESTVLPDGSMWTSQDDIIRFIDPKHPNFWRPEVGFIPWRKG
jgi:hypothetical protein